MLDTAIEAAWTAGQLIARRYPGGRRVTVKGYRNIVTEVDTAAEAVILGLIHERFPSHAVLSEEAGGSGIGEGIVWVVDPLDGTTNYAHRVPLFAVSIGVLEDGVPVAGVVHDPLRGQTFAARRGGGATLDGEPIRVSDTSRLAHAVVAFDWGHSDQVRARTFDHLLQIGPRCGTVRGLGSAALAQAYVAAGWLDGYLNLGLKPWDVAAGTLLVAEAGGRCTAPDGSAYRVDAPAGLATNGLLHDELLDLVR